MKVYILCGGLYEQRGVIGVFSTLERAKAIYADATWESDDSGWWAHAGELEITVEEVDALPPVRAVKEA